MFMKTMHELVNAADDPIVLAQIKRLKETLGIFAQAAHLREGQEVLLNADLTDEASGHTFPRGSLATVDTSLGGMCVIEIGAHADAHIGVGPHQIMCSEDELLAA